MRAQTACSREEPVPKLGPATKMVAPAYSGWLRMKFRSSRHSENNPAPKPVRSTRLSQSEGMIWSVSTSLRSGGMAGHRGSGGDGGRDQMGPAPAALTAFEIPVRGRRAPFTHGQLVRIHGQA